MEFRNVENEHMTMSSQGRGLPLRQNLIKISFVFSEY